jgi:hypothetical protein
MPSFPKAAGKDGIPAESLPRNTAARRAEPDHGDHPPNSLTTLEATGSNRKKFRVKEESD